MNIENKQVVHVVNRQVAQGDVLVTRVSSLPPKVSKVTPKDGRYIVGHSETGHHHVVIDKPGVEMFDTENPLISYLKVIDNVETTMEHLRSFDTHEPYLLKGGTYEIRRQRQKTPNGWERVQD